MNATEWAVECGYIQMITNAILGKDETGRKEFGRKFGGDVERFRQFCLDKQRQAEKQRRHDSVVYIQHCLGDLNGLRKLFTLPEFPVDRPLVEHPFYQWLLDNEDRIDTRHPCTISQYLTYLGFDIDRHKVDEGGLKTLHYVQYAYGDLWMPTRTPHSLEELFTPLVPNHRYAYHLRDGKRTALGTDHVAPTELLGNLIKLASPIFDLSPDQYYFEVIGDTLFIKYQHIIGSRRLCTVKEDV